MTLHSVSWKSTRNPMAGFSGRDHLDFSTMALTEMTAIQA